MKLGFVSLPFTGHLNPMATLARKMRTRGHEVVFIGIPDIEPTVRAAGLTFIPYCEKEFPVGSLDKYLAPISRLHGWAAVQSTNLHLTPGLAKAAFEHLPQLIKKIGVEALVIDTLHRFLELIPMSLNIPCVHIWNILHIDGTGTTPACIYDWPHEDTPEARTRNIEGLKKLGGLASSTLDLAKAYAEKAGLQIDWTNPATAVPKLAVITQTPKAFDFQGIPWPPQFHYAGPFHESEGHAFIPFPWEKLNGKPLIYASLGTLVNGLDHVYKIILEAVEKLPEAQVVLSIGRNIDPDNLGPIPTDTIVIRRAPQIELLKRAALCITHAGLNTTLESLAQGVPMVAIPIAFDQPGISARIAHHGVGEFVDLDNLCGDNLLKLIRKVLTNHSYAERAHFFKDVIANARGLDIAGDVIEQAFQKASMKK
ncbi:MAG TPA: nucleotide disphospho-sugar-binding domain-containing protein [Bryobacteraceae bacterium]|jgi:MGT family glycosyltransferase|nr:nucleotide disphospho-sugar-binding domain-containing protein [Bryobacteraceae bacterium]